MQSRARFEGVPPGADGLSVASATVEILSGDSESYLAMRTEHAATLCWPLLAVVFVGVLFHQLFHQVHLYLLDLHQPLPLMRQQ